MCVVSLFLLNFPSRMINCRWLKSSLLLKKKAFLLCRLRKDAASLGTSHASLTVNNNSVYCQRLFFIIFILRYEENSPKWLSNWGKDVC